MQGKRLYPDDTGDLNFTAPGEYGKTAGGLWLAAVPTEPLMVGSLASHDITEHDDGTITVSPSILIDDMRGRQWHGYLERGVWREV